MTGLGDGRDPIDVGLFEDSADEKKVDHSTEFGCDLGCLDRVVLGGFVKVPFLIVPLEHVSTRVMTAHFQIERDCNL